MKRILTLSLIVVFLGAGCASEKSWTDYHASVDKQTAALLAFAEKQASDRKAARTNLMSTYSRALSTAAITPEATDDIAIAIAFGYELGKPENYSLPSLPKITPPDKTSDLWRAATPIISMAVPFAWLAIDGLSDSGGDTYTVTDNAKLNIQSENAGSLNSARGDQSLTVTDNRSQVENDCIDCDGDGFGEGGEVNPLLPEEENPIEPGGPICDETDPTTFFLGPTGAYTDITLTCSCGSRAAGDC